MRCESRSRLVIPATLFTVKQLIAVTPVMAEKIDAYRFDAGISAESEAVRSLVELGLEAAKVAGTE